jgi:hypothetical protein
MFPHSLTSCPQGITPECDLSFPLQDLRHISAIVIPIFFYETIDISGEILYNKDGILCSENDFKEEEKL